MKITAWALMMFTLVLFGHEQASASDIWGEITLDGRLYREFDYSPRAPHIYPGNYTIKILVGNDNIGCSVRVGTKSSNTNLLNISGPLAVWNVTDPLHFFVKIGENLWGTSSFRGLPFKCGTTGTIRVSNPPTVVVPVMVTLTYGPFLQKTVPLLVTQPLGIKSVSASPAQQYYSLNQRVKMTLTSIRKLFSTEGYPPPPSRVYWRVREGKLCKATEYSDEPDLPAYLIERYEFTASNEWAEFESTGDFFENGTPLIKYANLCQRGRTIVEFAFPAEKINSEERIMTDSRITRIELMVPTQSTPRKSRIRSRGIDQLPPAVSQEPEPPALPAPDPKE